MWHFHRIGFALFTLVTIPLAYPVETTPLPETAQLVLSENWSTGIIDPARWYTPRKKWGNGNAGVIPENVRIESDSVNGKPQNVLVCEAHGDNYEGLSVGMNGAKARVGGVLVSKAFFASGRFEIVLKIGSTEPHPGGPTDPKTPSGGIAAVWTYAYRYIEVDKALALAFVTDTPLYNPHLARRGNNVNEYTSELDFPELGKNGDFQLGLYNAYCQNRENSKTFDTRVVADGEYHTLTTEWRTTLKPLDGVTDAQVIEHLGFFWIRDASIPFDYYLGNPLKRLSKDRYAVYCGVKATHWIDGKRIGENEKNIPAMAAQLTLGVWLPGWAGPAKWSTAHVRVAAVKVWQYTDPGDVRGILAGDLRDNFDKNGRVTK